MTTAHFSRMFQSVMGLAPSGTPAAANHIVDASNEGVAWVFSARTTDPITHIGFRYGARTGTPPTFIAGLEGVSSSTGFPDGTYKGGGTPASGTFTPPASTAWDGTWQWVALSNSYTAALSELLAITVRYSSGTIDASNNSSFTTNYNQLGIFQPNRPYGIRNTIGTWAMLAQGGGNQPVFGVRTANDRYGCIIQGNYTTRSASTVGHRQAMHIALPAGFGDTLKVVGFRTIASVAQAVGRNPLARIWSSSSTLASVTLDTDQWGGAAASAWRTQEIYFDTAVDLSFGTDYYIGFEVADATNGGVLIYGTQYASSDDKATDEGGAYFSLATFNGTSWTDDNTVRPWMELIVDDWEEPTSGGAIIGPMRVIQSAGRRR